MDDGWILERNAPLGVVTAEVTSSAVTPEEWPPEAHRTVVGTAASVQTADPGLIVALGADALRALAALESTPAPILPVDIAGLPSLSLEALPAAVAACERGACRLEHRPRLSVEGPTTTGLAVFDATLVTEEPAHISEYALSSRGEPVAQFRADGVVVATPAGSHGYAATAGGPSLDPSVRALAVVPVGPFVTQTRHWVLPEDDLRLTVERDEGPVAVCADDRHLETVGLGGEITVGVDDERSLAILETPQCGPSLE